MGMVKGGTCFSVHVFLDNICKLQLFYLLLNITGYLCSRLNHSVKDDLFFEITEPDYLRYTFKVRPAQNFGVPFRESLRNVGLVLAEPHHGCSPPTNKYDLQNNVALVERGSCSFLTKCIQADRVGILALIVTDNDIRNDDQYIDMIDDNTKRNCSIPAVFLLGKDGYMIRQRLQAHGLSRAIINIPINITTVPLHQQRHPPWQLW